MNTEQNNRVEEMLNSLDGCAKATAPDFFYTRLKARLEKETVSPAQPGWVLRPVYAVIALVLVLVINGFVLFQRNNTNSNLADTNESLQSVAAEYSLNDNNMNVYELTAEK